MVPTYFRRELRDRVLQRRPRLRTFHCLRIRADGRTEIEGRASRHRARGARETLRQAAHRGGRRAGETRFADRYHQGPDRVGLFADQERDRSGAADEATRGARRAAGAAERERARQGADLPRLDAGRPVDDGHARHSRAVDGRRRSRARHHAGAARGLRQARPSHRLWRRPLRPHVCAFAKVEGDHRHRARLCRAGNREHPGAIARRAARLCANGKAGVRFPE